MLLACLVAACVKGDTSCPRCLHGEGCGFCWTDRMCYNKTSVKWAGCPSGEPEMSARCVAELGGDAKPAVRYAIGFTILVVALMVDGALRICWNRHNSDNYECLEAH